VFVTELGSLGSLGDQGVNRCDSVSGAATALAVVLTVLPNGEATLRGVVVPKGDAALHGVMLPDGEAALCGVAVPI
jgi:hypothetical protein